MFFSFCGRCCLLACRDFEFCRAIQRHTYARYAHPLPASSALQSTWRALTWREWDKVQSTPRLVFLEKKMGEDYVDLACVVCLIQYPWWELNSLHGC